MIQAVKVNLLLAMGRGALLISMSWCCGAFFISFLWVRIVLVILIHFVVPTCDLDENADLGQEVGPLVHKRSHILTNQFWSKQLVKCLGHLLSKRSPAVGRTCGGRFHSEPFLQVARLTGWQADPSYTPRGDARLNARRASWESHCMQTRKRRPGHAGRLPPHWRPVQLTPVAPRGVMWPESIGYTLVNVDTTRTRSHWIGDEADIHISPHEKTCFVIEFADIYILFK